MNLYFRFFLLLVKRLFGTKKIDVFAPCTTPFRVTPSDLDLNFHVNNGRYLSLMDLGRFDILLKAKVFYSLVGKGFYPVVSSESIRFKRSLGLLERFELVTEVEAWEGKDFYMSQKFISKGRLVAEGFVKIRFKKRGQKGTVPVALLYEQMGIEAEDAKMTTRASLQKEIEASLAQEKTAA